MAEESSSTEISFLYFLVTYPYIYMRMYNVLSNFFFSSYTGTEEEGSFDCISFLYFLKTLFLKS